MHKETHMQTEIIDKFVMHMNSLILVWFMRKTFSKKI